MIDSVLSLLHFIIYEKLLNFQKLQERKHVFMKEIRKTKIVCTLGPSTDKGDVLRQLMLEGMNVARFNFSHGSHEEQKGRFEKLVELRKELNLPVAALLDTKGPEIRLKELEGGKAELKEGQLFTLALGDFVGDASRVAITYEDLHKDVKVGDRILIDDGLIEMKVVRLDGTDIVCEVVNGGMISNKKGVNVPNVELSMPFISETDYNDIVFGIENGYDFIAASFTRTADDILQIRKILDDHDCKSINIIAKIENKQGVDNIDEIIRVSDGIMVARGDMGVEIPMEDVPVIQKILIEKVYKAGKQVITATQMLDSMMKHPRPTRAETTDVANAVYDGTSAIMLSGENRCRRLPGRSITDNGKNCIPYRAGYQLYVPPEKTWHSDQSGYYKCHRTCDMHHSDGSECIRDHYCIQFRTYCTYGIQISPGLPDHRMLRKRRCMQKTEYVLGCNSVIGRIKTQFR